MLNWFKGINQNLYNRIDLIQSMEIGDIAWCKRNVKNMREMLDLSDKRRDEIMDKVYKDVYKEFYEND